ncbi:MAG: hypothetical protein WAO52_12845 [Prolixibacteraceae bacterium]
MKNKPILFEAACIFSISGSSIGFLSMFIAAIFFQETTKIITGITNFTATENLNPLYFALLGVAFAFSLMGALKLYRTQKTGLYFYLAAQVIIMTLPVFWLGSHSFSVTNAIFTFIFASVYLFNFKILKN